MPSREVDRTSGEVDDKTIQALIKLGDIDFILGRGAEARAEFDQAARLAERVSSANPEIGAPTAASGRRVRPDGGRNLTFLLRGAKRRDRVSPKIVRHSSGIVRGASRRPGHSPRLASLLNKLAGLRAKSTDFEGARKLYEESLQSLKTEPVTDKNRAEILSDVRFTLGRIAIVASQSGARSQGACGVSRLAGGGPRAFAIDPKNVSYLRQLGFAFDYLGTACLECGELGEADLRWSPFATTAGRPSLPIPPIRRLVAASHWPINTLATWLSFVAISMSREPLIKRR